MSRDKPSARQSVLAHIVEQSGITPRVFLQASPSGEASPDDLEPARGGRSRYQVLGEIARGGVGVVLRGRDVDLGRDVAMKVIRPEHAESREILHRFVEEAQIGGQLQHPGMVPVYEFGLGEDRRAYFTMKLIQGETLSALLRARKSPAKDQRRFLSIFEQICQTVAYAHARGVVHRDLKPANVMVGAFGEVQVVDWGFAKVLARGGIADEIQASAEDTVRTVRSGPEGSHSQVGSVLGTPAYMPPEQALGRIDAVDERSDVFALGAILCEILTGEPAYAKAADEVFLQAAQADLADAWARLEACEADRDLVELARSCLSAQAEERPANAGELAEAVGRHLASVEERARAAEIAAAEAQVEAKGERRARKLTLGLAAAVLLAMVFGGGGYAWIEKERRARADRAARVVRNALDQARSLRAKALADPLGNLAEWDAALEAARSAVELAGGVEREVVDEAAALLAKLEREVARAHENAGLVAKLDEIRVRRGDRFDLKEADEAYASAFAGLVDPESVDASVANVETTGIADHLVPALDEWSWVRGRLDKPQGGLEQVASRLDADSWRVQLRRAALAGDRDELMRLAGSLGESAFQGNTPYLMSLHLSAAGARGRALAILRDAQRRRPGDFWLSYQLAYELTRVDPPQWQESVSYYGAALASRPESVETRRQLGIAYRKLGQADRALETWQDAIEREPDFVRAYEHVLEVYEEREQLDEIIATLRRRAERFPDNPSYWVRLGHALMLQGKWEEARGSYKEARRLAPEESLYLTFLGDTYLYQQDADRAEAYYRQAIALDEHAHHAYNALGWVYGMRMDYEPGYAAHRKAIELKPDEPAYRNALGQALVYSKSDIPEQAAPLLAEGLAVLEETIRLFPDYAPPYETLGFLYEQRGEYDAAIAAYERLIRLEQHLFDRRFQTFLRAHWDFATMKVKRRTAELGNKVFYKQGVFRIAILHRKRGDHASAIRYARRALELEPDHPMAHGFVGLCLQRLGRHEEAVVHFRKMLERAEDRPQLRTLVRWNLAWVLMGVGRYEEALEQLGAYHAESRRPKGWEYSAEEWERECRRSVELHRHLGEILNGDRQLESAQDQYLFGQLCANLGRSAAAVRFFEQAFAADPDLALGVAYDLPPAFCCEHLAWNAIVAAGGRCADAGDVGDADRPVLRRKAHDWLRVALAEWQRRSPEDRRIIVPALDKWLRGPEVRGEVWAKENLEKLPADEQALWRSFWRDVETTVAELRK